MTDQEIVDGLINRDEKITDWFFNIKYRPLFINVIKLIFDLSVRANTMNVSANSTII